MTTPAFTRVTGVEITMDDFGPASAAYFAAEISDSDGRIYLWIREPEARIEAQRSSSPNWDEDAFQDAVRAFASEEFYGPESEAPQDETFVLTFDPQRDQTIEEEVERPAD